MFLLIGSPSPYWPTMAMVNCTLSGVTRAGNKFLAAAREHAGDVRGRRDANARAHVAEIARILEQHDRRRPPIGEHGVRVHHRALGKADHAR